MRRECTVQYIDHVGVAVNEIEASMGFFRDTFGIESSTITVMEEHGVKAALLMVGQTRLELLEPLGPETAVGRFLQRRGEGLHHLALNVNSVGRGLEVVKARGLRVIDRKPREGLTGMVAFIHPESTGGILMELVESIE
ncbi:MAG: methylmalonyl-CoA epimerase [Dehalococcoidia bacterium]|nr:methylmalonyl-CoA epimerase [Dehalococcoidia bacterium]|tara:strand:- start:150 stop:566 length:417 start_codon:yes stop_codon:yes gene_type:complete